MKCHLCDNESIGEFEIFAGRESNGIQKTDAYVVFPLCEGHVHKMIKLMSASLPQVFEYLIILEQHWRLR